MYGSSAGPGTANYTGSRALRPPETYTENNRAPTQYDSLNYVLLDQWLWNKRLWILFSLEGNRFSQGQLADWREITTGTNYANQFVADDGNTAIPLDNILHITGQSPLTTRVNIPGSAIFEVGFEPATNGQLIIGSTGANPVWANLTSMGGTVTITNGPGSINLEAVAGPGNPITLVGNVSSAVTLAGSVNVLGAGPVVTTGDGAQTLTISIAGIGGLSWVDVTGTSQAMAVNTGYTANNAGLVTLTLPATAAYGSVFWVCGKGAGGWRIAQNGGQTIHFGAVNTTTGAGGSLSSSLRYDTVLLLCTVADTEFTVLTPMGDITYV